ncbi:hypothetical protein FSP39_021568 [Pinctada imbricata]|uniref:Potassium channel domain-containing protein n=1 Tax=Pinctada imbricata TaxID=66713 RepID=A0AA89C408_PINIB|nr:hypothetical protein FSP39_021568 [Pinctada imbricata]
MDWKALLILSIINVIYVMIGGAIFHALESSNEDNTKATISSEYATFLANQTCVTADELRTFVQKVLAAYDDGVFSTDTESSASLWDYGNSVFFAMTAVTTIGYGNQTPVTSGGRAFACVFAVIGIPLTLVMLAAYGTKIQKLLSPLEKKIWIKNHVKVDKVVKTITLILAGFIAFFIIPAAIFSSIEGWTFGEGIYYSIITLTTVGFGDFVIGTSDSDYRIPYRLLTAIWLVLGLSWVALLISDVQNKYTGAFDKSKEKEEEDKKEDDEKNKSVKYFIKTSIKSHGEKKILRSN